MQIKSKLRKEMKARRAEISDKSKKDKLISDIFLNSDLYKNCRLLLCYSSCGSEISTSRIISAAFADGKAVAFPLCLDSCGNMEFYFVASFNDLNRGMYGILEPNTDKCCKITDYSDALCLVPGLCFDLKGFRLGYGKGYYDRFLEKFTIKTAGLCYNELIQNSLPIDIYDVSVDYIITQTGIITL